MSSSSNAPAQPANPAAIQQDQTQTDPSSAVSDPSDLSALLLGGQGTHHAADDTAARAMSHTSEWKPALDRRQSWSAQEYKHELHRRQLQAEGGGGFSEAGKA
ncbi:hypothetical protein MFIFM68171_09903 [Madurella fahalii]|uniref:Uncharacterized protein n=1 Tax=Madurella fahalii TaxID=1157608 RepID=A0ABQ0GPM3_9PEZI